MPNITPFLWFDNQAEEAAKFYTGIFPNSRIVKTTRFGEGSPGTVGSVMVVDFDLDGKRFSALNGGPRFNFTEAISFAVECGNQSEVDHYWSNLLQGGQESQCGWLKDQYGVSWQIVPKILLELLNDPDPEKSKKAMAAMLKMKKIDIAALQKAVGLA